MARGHWGVSSMHRFTGGRRRARTWGKACILCEGGPDASMELGVVQLGESSTCHLQLVEGRGFAPRPPRLKGLRHPSNMTRTNNAFSSFDHNHATTAVSAFDTLNAP